MAKRKANPTFLLAYWFVTEFLGKQWSHNIHLRHLANAKSFLSPKKDPNTGEKPKSFTPDQIKECLLDMQRNGVRNINTLRAVTWADSTGATYIEKFTETPPPPPIYLTMERATWEKRYGLHL